MLEKVTIQSQDVVVAIRVLEQEINSRIKYGDGDIEALQTVTEALGSADRIVIE
jgi:hypothetical protein